VAYRIVSFISSARWPRTLGVMNDKQSPASAPEAPNLGSFAIVLALPCNLVLLIWGVHTLLKPGGPRGEELLVVYEWVVPLVMVPPAWVAIHSWLDRWALTKSQLVLRNAPFALAVAVWVWVAFLPV
jgi:hypothetical protein